MTEPLAVRIRHRLRFVESYADRQLFVQCLEVLESPDFVPKVPHPDGSGDPAMTTGSSLGDWSADSVIEWFARHDIKLMPWQVTVMSRL